VTVVLHNSHFSPIFKIFEGYTGWREMSSKIHKTALELKQAKGMDSQNPSQN
jgi:hypothetical protein